MWLRTASVSSRPARVTGSSYAPDEAVMATVVSVVSPDNLEPMAVMAEMVLMGNKDPKDLAVSVVRRGSRAREGPTEETAWMAGLERMERMAEMVRMERTVRTVLMELQVPQDLEASPVPTARTA